MVNTDWNIYVMSSHYIRSKLPVWRDINIWTNSAIKVTVQVLEYWAGYLLKQITADSFSILTALVRPKIAWLWSLSSSFVKHSIPVVLSAMQLRLWNQCQCEPQVWCRAGNYHRGELLVTEQCPIKILHRALQVRLWLRFNIWLQVRHTSPN